MSWKLQPYAGKGPFHVEQCGHVWIIANERGVNVAHTDRGAVWFTNKQSAREVLEELQE